LGVDIGNGLEWHQPLALISSSSDKSVMIWRPDPESGVFVNEVKKRID